jgi:hypothetical protein
MMVSSELVQSPKAVVSIIWQHVLHDNKQFECKSELQNIGMILEAFMAPYAFETTSVRRKEVQ